MTTHQPGLLHYLFPSTSLLAALSLGGGIYGLAAPAKWAAATIGIPSSSMLSNAEQAYAAFAAARNFGGGITLAALIASGNRQAVAIFLMAGVTTALTDAWICARFGGDLALRHALMGGLIAAVGYGVWLTS